MSDQHPAGGSPPSGTETPPTVPTNAPSDPPTMADAAEMLWIVLANVSGGDWTKQSTEWQAAAARWRDYYFAALNAHLSLDAGTGQPQTPDRAALEALVEKWRAKQAEAYVEYEGRGVGQCADELSAVLSGEADPQMKEPR